jgi:hypothetical protein
VELVLADGRNYLLGTRERFDVIVGDLFVPWHAGTGDLYTVEHFRTVKRRLAPGGLFAQCLPGYQLAPEELRSIAASLLAVFDQVALWRCDFDHDHPVLILVAYRDAAAYDPASIELACERLAAAPFPRDLLLAEPAAVPMLFLGGDRSLRDWAQGAPLNTDNRPYIEYVSPGSYFRHRQKDVAPMHDFMNRFRPRDWTYPSLPEAGRGPEDLFRAADLWHDAQRALAAQDFGRECALLEELARLAGDLPGVAAHVRTVAARYRARHMIERSDRLLAALGEHRGPRQDKSQEAAKGASHPDGTTDEHGFTRSSP